MDTEHRSKLHSKHLNTYFKGKYDEKNTIPDRWHILVRHGTVSSSWGAYLIPIFFAVRPKLPTLYASILSGLLLSMVSVSHADVKSKSQPLADAIIDGTPDISFRYRYADISDDGFAKDSKASTLQTLVGYKTGEFHNFDAYVQFRDVSVIGGERYNDGINGKTDRPPEVDPKATEVDQAYIQYENYDTKFGYGRRKLKWGNLRFVSALGWRQNNRSFDGVFLENNSIDDLELKYSYAYNINRAGTDKSASGNFDGDTHLLNLVYSGLPWGTLTGYGYLLDLSGFTGASNNSTKTYGLSFGGQTDLSDGVKLAYYGEYATQGDNGDNPNSFDLDYFHGHATVSWEGLALKLGYEELEGDGTTGFGAPLGLLHAFNGWADKFTNTPATGLEDSYAQISYKVSGVNEYIDGLKLIAAYHNFDASKGSVDHADEWDAAAIYPFLGHYEAAVHYTSFDADDASPLTDVDKIWFTLSAKF